MLTGAREPNGGTGSQGADQPPAAAGPPGLAWLGGWLCILALAGWLAQLSPGWLIAAALGAVAWSQWAVRRGRRWSRMTTVMLWVAVAAAAGGQYQLHRIAADWEEVQHEVEERAADALNSGLDDLVQRGEAAVVEAERALADAADGAASERVFQRLEMIRRQAGFSAVAVFDSAAAPVAWVGEHRGEVPFAVRRSITPYIFHEGPLFSYLYFVRSLENGGTAMGAVLLESKLASADGTSSFAARFAERHGVVPRFTRPSRAQGTSIWDWSVDRPILSVSFSALTTQDWWLRVQRHARWGVGLAWLVSLVLLSVQWYRRRSMPGLPVAIATGGLLVIPLGSMFDARDLFSAQFVLPLPWWDVSLGMFLVLLTGASVWLLIRFGPSRALRPRLPWWLQALLALVYLPAGLQLVRRSTSGALLANQPAGGFFLQLAATLLLAIPLFLFLAYGRGAGRGRIPQRTLLGLAAALALGLAVVTVTLWDPAGRFPAWWPALWSVPFALLALGLPGFSRRSESIRIWVLAGFLASTVALPTLWVWHIGARLQSAERELARLGTETDPYLDFLLRVFGDKARTFSQEGERGVNLLYHAWVASGLARQGYEARLTLWRFGHPFEELRLTRSAEMPELIPQLVQDSAGIRDVVVQQYRHVEGLHYLALVPLADGEIVSVAVPPRSRLSRATALARFLQPDVGPEANASVESLFLVPSSDPVADSIAAERAGPGRQVRWEPTETGWRSEARAHFPSGWMHAHLFVRTSTLSLLLIRGLLTGTALLALLLALWVAARAMCAQLTELALPRAEWLGSFRGRLTLALFVFFLLPTGAFGVVAYSAVSREVIRSAESFAFRALEQTATVLPGDPLSQVAAEVGVDLLLYRRGELSRAAAPEMLELGLFDTWLPPQVYLEFASGEDLEEVERRKLGQNQYLVAYRRLDPGVVLAAPIPLAADEIARRQMQFRDIALMLSLLGAALSVVLSLLVGRALARPLDELSRAAATVGAGNLRIRLPESRADEFGSVYRSFNRMVHRLRRARTALIRETRRTETIVAEAATGVLALDAQGAVELVNPRAAEILGSPLEVGRPLPEVGPVLPAVAEAFRAFWRSGATEAGTELEVEGRIVRLRMRRLNPQGTPGGAVVALEDVTAEVRSARVLAWGEMARQVAHEIKNPLTPIKLAVQHLRRAYTDRRPDYGDILDRNVESILQEIDRLGEIARAFARFGTPASTVERLESVDVARAVEETLALYRGAGEGIRYEVQLESVNGTRAVARLGELKEVLVNLLENAREALDGGGEIHIAARPSADGRWVEVVVEDSGEGIPPELLPRIFEPHFSTRTSGTGLGLAIVRRMVESWGGEISAESEPGVGTRMRMRLPAAAPED